MEPAALVGQVLDGKYRVEALLGEGGMGVVLAARHLELDQPVAIKLLRGRVGAIWRKRFLREARAASRIESDYVAPVLDVAKLEDGTLYMVMELLEGRDLADIIYDEGALSVDEVARYGIQACEALAAAHAIGIVHRDVKPANLFLTTRPDGSPCVKLLDFGISKDAGDASAPPRSLTGTHAVLGSPQFMSPEQLVSSRDVDPRTDIWSLGATLFELLALEPPFPGESVAELYTAILRDPPTPLSERNPAAPEDLEAVLLRCLAKDRDERVQTAEELAELLRPFVSDESTLPPSRAPASARWPTAARTTGASTGPPSSRSPSSRSPLSSRPVRSAMALASTAPAQALRRWTPEPATLVIDGPDGDDDDDDALDRTPAGSVRPVVRSAPPPPPRRRLAISAALLAGLLVTTLGLARAWSPVSRRVSTGLPVVVATPPGTSSPAITAKTAAPSSSPSPTPSSRFTDSTQLGDALRAELEMRLSTATKRVAAGQLERARDDAQVVLKELSALGIRPNKAVSSLGAQAELVRGRIEGAVLRGRLSRVMNRADAERLAALVDPQMARTRAAYERVRAWGVRSFYRCALVEAAALDLAIGRTFADAFERAKVRDRRWLLNRAVTSLRFARSGYRHALDVQAETMLCFEPAERGYDEAGRLLSQLAR
jgi:serine/threonine-protein kinase